MSHILIVEDDPDLLDLYRIALFKEGRKITVANTSIMAISYLQDPAYTPDAIFLDINMNTGVSGLGIMQMVRHDPRLTHVPIIIVTANDQYRDYAIRSGVSDFLVKPVHITALTEVADKLAA